MKVKYIDARSMRFMIKKYPDGVSPKYGDVLEVEESEARALLKMKNGTKPIFEKVSERKISVGEEA